MLEESKEIKPGFRYSQARTLFEDDPRWKVSLEMSHACMPVLITWYLLLSSQECTWKPIIK